MTPAGFRRMALALEGAAEGAHMGHPDFRLAGRIFATLGYPDGKHGMVKLTASQQADILETDRAGAFRPGAGAWGRKGATTVDLAVADRELVRIALQAAWTNLANPTPAKRKPRGK